jgi:hypothetical protein
MMRYIKSENNRTMNAVSPYRRIAVGRTVNHALFDQAISHGGDPLHLDVEPFGDLA